MQSLEGVLGIESSKTQAVKVPRKNTLVLVSISSFTLQTHFSIRVDRQIKGSSAFQLMQNQAPKVLKSSGCISGTSDPRALVSPGPLFFKPGLGEPQKLLLLWIFIL